MVEVKKFKFASNLDFVCQGLKDKGILFEADWENNILYCEEKDKQDVFDFINSLNLDENDVEVDENFQNDFEDWHKNSLNPGHFTGGKIPFFFWNVKNYPFILFTIFFVPIISGVIIFLLERNEDLNLSFDFFDIIIFLFYLFVGVSMLLQWTRYKKNKTNYK